jgi:hypothetical protein
MVRLDATEPLVISIAPRGGRTVELEWPAGEPWPAELPPDVAIRADVDGVDLQSSDALPGNGLLRLTLSGLRIGRTTDVVVHVPDVGWAHLPHVAPGTEPLRARLTACSHVRGRVLDPEGKPVAGAGVEAWLDREPPDAQAWRLNGTCEGVTDASGRFDLRPFGQGLCTLRAEDARERRSLAAEVRTDGPPVELALAPMAVASGRIVGVDPRKEDEYGVLVVPHGANHEDEPAAESDGFFEVSWPGAAPATLIARNHTDRADGRVAVLEVPKTGGDGLRLVLKPGLTVTGRVVDAAGQPVPNASVTISGRWGDDSTRTGADGRFISLPQPDDALDLYVASEGRDVHREVRPGEVEITLPVTSPR